VVYTRFVHTGAPMCISSFCSALMATSLSQDQCKTIMKPLLDAALPALGINRHLTRTVVHGPRLYQGLSIPELWTLQGILKLWIAVAHGDAATITGCNLRAALSLHTIELGLPGHMFQQDFDSFEHIATPSWLTHMWLFCQTATLQLHPSAPTIPLQRENGSYLMVQFHQYGYSKTDLYHLNLCRLWCHAICLTDITTGDGLRIHPLSWLGYPTLGPHTDVLPGNVGHYGKPT
jgi:hypothetical protein